MIEISQHDYLTYIYVFNYFVAIFTKSFKRTRHTKKIYKEIIKRIYALFLVKFSNFLD